MRKEDARAAIEAMDAEFELDALVERLIFLEQIDLGLQDAKAGRTHSHEDVLADIEKWKADARNSKSESDAA